jgi:membrane protein
MTAFARHGKACIRSRVLRQSAVGKIETSMINRIRYVYDVAFDAFYKFLADDGWAIASHIALSALMALFPFLIVITALAAFVFGSKELADQAASLMFDAWPHRVADTLSSEIHDVLTNSRGDILTLGVVLAVYFASNGVEALRIGLNRAYGIIETRRWYWLRLESIGYTLLAAVSLLSLAFFIVLAPLIIAGVKTRFSVIVQDNETLLTIARYTVASTSMIVALFVAHKWLPGGRRRLVDILPGILLTIFGSLISGYVFGKYLERFTVNYVTTYAGLASVIIALVFLYFIASIFVYGGEFNAAVLRKRNQSDE